MKGIGVTKEIALGKVHLIKDIDFNNIPQKSTDPVLEEERLNKAVLQSKEEIEQIISGKSGASAQILASHLNFLEDPAFIAEAAKKIHNDSLSAEKAVLLTTEELNELFLSFDEQYLRERAADIKDVGERVLRNLLGYGEDNLESLPENTIIVAKDLAPSQTASLDKEKVIGFVTEEGGKTGHTAIMAKTMGIAAVVGCKGIIDKAATGDFIIVDAANNQVLLNPENNIIEEYERRKQEREEHKQKLERAKDIKLTRSDGRPFLVAANIGSIEQAVIAKEKGADGIGLFRTEFLFMDRADMPTEEEQFVIYKEVAKIFGEAPVIVRTLDIGGDKSLPYLSMPKEENPFLGVRAIRLCFKNREMFYTQLKALLRAAVYGNLKIMFPMIGSIKELKQAKLMVEECKAMLKSQGVTYKEDIELGMMIEIPAAAVMADQFAEEADFFSIGTNDLTQYTLAVDRGNTELDELYDNMHPAVLWLIENTIKAARKKNIFCGMCGEMAGEEAAVGILAKYGLDEFSVSPDAIAATKVKLLEQSDISRAEN